MLWIAASWVSSNFNGGNDGVVELLLIIFDIMERNHSGVSDIFSLDLEGMVTFYEYLKIHDRTENSQWYVKSIWYF